MPGTTTPPSSDSLWPEPPPQRQDSLSFLSSHKTKSTNNKDPLFSIDEAPDFHNPFSDLNLFLSQKIKQEMRSHGSIKKWSLKIQEDLIQHITPDFQKKFPHYRLGVSALRKMWEKITYYLHHIQEQKEAITQEGKLNIPFFIKENLKTLTQHKMGFQTHPHNFAHQLAVKMCECIATIDGIKPKLDHLTKTIWALQRHMLSGVSPEQLKSPYDEYDKIDKLIVKLILEITAKEPQIGQRELEHKVKESLHSLHELPSFATTDMMTLTVAALFSEKLYSSLDFHLNYRAEQKKAVIDFIDRQINLSKLSGPALKQSAMVRRICALYSLASSLPKDLSDETLGQAVSSFYGPATGERPALPQSVYAFISAELVLAKPDQSLDAISSLIVEAYHETQLLPSFAGKEWNNLEIIIWKILSEKEKLLEKLPYRIGQRIEEEIANTLIDNPKQSFSLIVQMTVQFFQRIKELGLGIHKQAQEIERKIHLWTIQGDMLCRWIRLDHDAPLLKLICERYRETLKLKQPINHLEFVSGISTEYLRQHPELAPYSPQVNVRIWILYKYSWYTLMADPKESSLDRFLGWHNAYIKSQSPHLEQEKRVEKLEELCGKILPHIPIDPTQLTSVA